MIPAYNFAMLHEDVRYLHPDSTYEGVENIKFTDEMPIIADKLTLEYFKAIGVSDSFVRQRRTEKNVAMMRLDYIITGDRQLITEIEIQEMKLASATGSEKGMGIHDLEAALTISTGVNIDARKTSAIKFYTMLKRVNEQNEQQRKAIEATHGKTN